MYCFTNSYSCHKKKFLSCSLNLGNEYICKDGACIPDYPCSSADTSVCDEFFWKTCDGGYWKYNYVKDKCGVDCLSDSDCETSENCLDLKCEVVECQGYTDKSSCETDDCEWSENNCIEKTITPPSTCSASKTALSCAKVSGCSWSNFKCNEASSIICSHFGNAVFCPRDTCKWSLSETACVDKTGDDGDGDGNGGDEKTVVDVPSNCGIEDTQSKIIRAKELWECKEDYCKVISFIDDNFDVSFKAKTYKYDDVPFIMKDGEALKCTQLIQDCAFEVETYKCVDGDKEEFETCQLTDWMSSVIGEDNIESCGARLAILIAIFLFILYIIPKKK